MAWEWHCNMSIWYIWDFTFRESFIHPSQCCPESYLGKGHANQFVIQPQHFILDLGHFVFLILIVLRDWRKRGHSFRQHRSDTAVKNMLLLMSLLLLCLFPPFINSWNAVVNPDLFFCGQESKIFHEAGQFSSWSEHLHRSLVIFESRWAVDKTTICVSVQEHCAL